MRPTLFLAALAALLATAGQAGTVLRGDHTLTAEDPRFGGLSGLLMDPDGLGLMAVSDKAVLFQARLHRDAEGRVEAIEPPTALHLHDNRHRPAEGFHGDAEDLARGPGKRIFVSFEGYSRVAAFDLPDPNPKPAHRWDLFQSLWNNESLEGLTRLTDGRLLAIVELAGPQGYPVWLEGKPDWRAAPPLPGGDGGYAATGADLGPDGRLYLLERRYNFLGQFQTRVRRFAIGFDAQATPVWGPGETVLETRPGDLDNMEGISLWQDTGRKVMVMSLISDDNFRWMQSTRLVEYDLVPDPARNPVANPEGAPSGTP